MDHLIEACGVAGVQVGLAISEGDSPPQTKADFHAFPAIRGWTLNHDYKLEIHEQAVSPTKFNTLLQAWLFFGLIFVVAQKEGRPILRFEELHDGAWLDTKRLNDTLREWTEWELNHREGIWSRMIQIDYVLEKARCVVRQNCGYNIRTEEVGYSTEKDHTRYCTDENALAIMIVGERLSAVKAKITEAIAEKTTISGWQGDNDGGWGPPRYVFSKMKSQDWCRSAVSPTSSQLGSNATLLLQAYYTYKDSAELTKEHGNCTFTSCRATTENGGGNYANVCLPDCPLGQKGGCEMLGPDMDRVISILRSAEGQEGVLAGVDIPLVKFQTQDPDDPTSVLLEVEALGNLEDKGFATISHVWTDSWGNESSNRLRTCQLQFIKRQLRRVSGGKDIYFWMDTLLIPVREREMSEEMKILKRIAINQIFAVFEKSKFTIVLDNGLHSMDPGQAGPLVQSALKILASGWMRRLWTLQESFLSNKIYVTFKKSDLNTNKFFNLGGLEGLDKTLLRAKHQSKSPVVKSVRDLLLHYIMGQAQGNKTKEESPSLYNNQISFQKDQAAFVVASTWRAARWRTTSRQAHETLALATLLNLDFNGNTVNESGMATDASEEQIDDLACEFWKTFNRQDRGCIPPGIIFLPGEKVQGKPGYGWAPRTFSTHESAYLEPLSRWNAPTDLETGGLSVTYPGFLLHTYGEASRLKILGTDNLNYEFTFAVDPSFLERYSVKTADPDQSAPFLGRIASAQTQLAIILSRPQLRDSPPEIGLLVEIYESGRVQQAAEQSSTQAYSCRIIRRVLVWRETRANYLSGLGRNELPMRQARGSQEVIGKLVPSNQRWVVDGFLLGEYVSKNTQIDAPNTSVEEITSTYSSRPSVSSFSLVSSRTITSASASSAQRSVMPQTSSSDEAMLKIICNVLSIQPETRRLLQSFQPDSLRESISPAWMQFGAELWKEPEAFEDAQYEIASLVNKSATPILERLLSRVYDQSPPEPLDLGDSRTAKVFLTGGSAFRNLINRLRYTANSQQLHLAVYDLEISTVNQLIENGSDLNQPDHSGKRPLTLAIERSVLQDAEEEHDAVIAQPEVLEIFRALRDGGAKIDSTLDPKDLDALLMATVEEWRNPTWTVSSPLDIIVPMTAECNQNDSLVLKDCEVCFASAWEIPEYVVELYSRKASEHPGASVAALLPVLAWSPSRIFSELAKTVVITGSSDSYEIGSYEELLERLWPGVGLDALRLIAAGAFLFHVNEAAHPTTAHEVEDYVMSMMRSDAAIKDGTDEAREIFIRLFQREPRQKRLENMVLSIMFGYLREASPTTSETATSFPFTFENLSQNMVALNFESSCHNHLPEALAWICRAMRSSWNAGTNSRYRTLHLSTGICRKFLPRLHHGKVLLVQGLKALRETSSEELGRHSCWTSFFSHGLLVWHTLDRSWGRGLGMSLDMMIHLSGANGYYWINTEDGGDAMGEFDNAHVDTSHRDEGSRLGGYVLGGIRMALIPVEQNDTTHEIQWHLERTESIIDYSSLKRTKERWLKIHDPNLPQTTRCFVGWHERAEVLLGTNELSTMIDWSDADRHLRSLHRTGGSVGLTLGPAAAITSPVQVGATTALAFNWVNHVQAYEPSKEFNDAVLSEHDKTALVIDTKDKRAYLVPKLSLLLHLCRTEAHRQSRRRATDNKIPPHIPAARPDVDGFQAAHETLMENWDKAIAGSGPSAQKLEKLVTRIHYDLMRAAVNRKSPRRMGFRGTSEIFCTELRDLIQRPDRGSILKVVRGPELLSWLRLAELADAVCVCSNLGPAIRPVRDADPAVHECPCYELPCGRFLLAAHMWGLVRILEPYQSSISQLRDGWLDFGDMYRMYLSEPRLWTRGRHRDHDDFWEVRDKLVHFIEKEKGKSYVARRLLGTTTTDHCYEVEWEPKDTGVLVFGV